jgi:hypothetical protein
MSVLIIGGGVILASILARHPGPITREYAERVWGVDEEGGDDSQPKGRTAPA